MKQLWRGWTARLAPKRRRNIEAANGRRSTADVPGSEKSSDQDTKAGIRAEDTVEKLLALRSVRDQLADAGFDLSSSQGIQPEELEARLVEHIVAERRLREGGDQVTVAVVGDFNSGKSTFINALLKTDLCPTGDEPTTSSVTFFFHGDEERIELLEPGGTRRRLSRDAYGTLVRHRKQGDQVPAVFHISLASQVLEHVRIVDTPGFDAPPPNSNDTEVTEREIAESDVLFVLMDANKGNPSKSLLEQLQRLQESLAADRRKPMFLLVNKAEGLPPRQRATVSNENREKYQSLFRAVASMSAKLLQEQDATQEAHEDLLTRQELLSKMVKPVAKERHAIAEQQFHRRSTQIRDDLVTVTAWLSDTIDRDRRVRPAPFHKKRALDKIDEGCKIIKKHMYGMLGDVLESAVVVGTERIKERVWSADKHFFNTRFKRQRRTVQRHSAWTQIGEVLKGIMDELEVLGLRELPILKYNLRRKYLAEIKTQFLDSITSVEDKLVRELRGVSWSVLWDDENDSWLWDEKESCWKGSETEHKDSVEYEAKFLRERYGLLLEPGLACSAAFIREGLRERIVSFEAYARAQSDQQNRELKRLRDRIGIFAEGLE